MSTFVNTYYEFDEVTVGVLPRPGRIRPRTKRVVVKYTGDVPVSQVRCHQN